MHDFAFLFNCIAVILYPIISLLLLLLICLIFWKRRFSRILLAIAIIVLYFSANGVISQRLVRPLEALYHPISTKTILANRALIVLGGGATRYPGVNELTVLSRSRLLEAYQIYVTAKRHHISYTLFLSGGNPNRERIAEATLLKKKLIELGVPEKNIVTETKSKNTYQNAQFLKPILAHYHFKQYLLVTTGIHMRRSQIYFAHFGIKTIAAPSDFPYPTIGWIPSSYDLFLQWFAIHEYIGIARLRVYDAFDLNQAKATEKSSQ